MYESINFAQGSTFGQCLYCFLLYCFLLLFTFRGNVSNLFIKDDIKGGRIFLFCGLLLFALTSFVGDDFFHYYEFMSEYRGQIFGDQDSGLETFYQYLIHYIHGNYFLFRLIVWGSSLFLIVYAVRRLEINVYHTLFVILAGFIITFSYARVTLAMAMLSLGVVMICVAAEQQQNKRIVSTIVGLLVALSSIYFHRSMLPVIVIAICWSLMPWKKQITKYSLWLFPVLVAICSIILKVAFEEIFQVANAVEDESGMLDRAEFYSEQDSIAHNANGYIRLFLHYTTFYFPLLLLSNAFRSESVLQSVDKRAIWLYQFVYLVFVFATSFLFMDFESETLFYRYLYMSFIPMSMLIVYMKDKGTLTKAQYLLIVACFVLSNLFDLFGVVYGKMR